jgi:hypothetical protein
MAEYRYKVRSTCTGETWFETNNYNSACMAASAMRAKYKDDSIMVEDRNTGRAISEVYYVNVPTN